jgi:hypothetical protein
MADLAPIPQLAGISLLAYATVWIARRFEIESPLQAALAAFPLLPEAVCLTRFQAGV